MNLLSCVTCLALSALTTAIATFWATHHPYSDSLFSAILACVAIAGPLLFVGLGGVMRLAHERFARWIAKRRLGASMPLTGYILIEKPQPTL